MIQFCGQDIVIKKDFSTRGMILYINGNGKIVVKMNYLANYSDEEIQGFIERHKRFLENQLVYYANTQLPDFSNGGRVYLLGKEYTVLCNEAISSFAVEGNILKVPIRFFNWESERFFGDLLLPYVKTLTELYAKEYGLQYSYIDLHTRYTQWGTHFTESNAIKYNMALIFVPEDCIEYVVVHELCHSLHHNHGKAFWEEVGRIYPRYKEIKKLLNSYSIEWLFERAKLGKGSF